MAGQSRGFCLQRFCSSPCSKHRLPRALIALITSRLCAEGRFLLQRYGGTRVGSLEQLAARSNAAELPFPSPLWCEDTISIAYIV